MTALRDYTVRQRWFDGKGWQVEECLLTGVTIEAAWGRASALATALDAQYGNGHFWNVFLRNGAGEDIVELFHGRLS